MKRLVNYLKKRKNKIDRKAIDRITNQSDMLSLQKFGIQLKSSVLSPHSKITPIINGIVQRPKSYCNFKLFIKK